ncbi:MAG: patatin-like phospholipase family protein [Methylacidiphilales bacterium]|nr:patatin-like phospholipase family protein [Candidatus Methylacidiphilales bacterium]
MKNILSLDGGGTRGIFSLQILHKIESLLRIEKKDPNLVLADHFHYIGGTSTGAIIAAALSWGAAVDDIEKFYLNQTYQVFSYKNWYGKQLARLPIWVRFSAEPLNILLKEYFSEETQDEHGTKIRKPALLGSPGLRTRYLCVMRNASTGAPWVITNSPGAMYNNRSMGDCNLDIPIFQLIRASTAAPLYFAPEAIEAGGKKWVFMDGALTPYNNPAYIMYLTAVLPAFGNNWETGEDKMRIISIGTGRRRVKMDQLDVRQIMVMDQLKHAVPALIDSNNQYQDLCCRLAGRCLIGTEIDTEMGSMVYEQLIPGDPRKFLYCRYNHKLTDDEVREGLGIHPDFFGVDNLPAIPFLKRLGQEYAENVRIGHLV